MVKAGHVRVHDKPVKKADLKVEPEEVTLDGEALEAPYGLLAMLHKMGARVDKIGDSTEPLTI